MKRAQLQEQLQQDSAENRARLAGPPELQARIDQARADVETVRAAGRKDVLPLFESRVQILEEFRDSTRREAKRRIALNQVVLQELRKQETARS
jgi:hypothetical protein